MLNCGCWSGLFARVPLGVTHTIALYLLESCSCAFNVSIAATIASASQHMFAIASACSNSMASEQEI